MKKKRAERKPRPQKYLCFLCEHYSSSKSSFCELRFEFLVELSLLAFVLLEGEREELVFLLFLLPCFAAITSPMGLVDCRVVGWSPDLHSRLPYRSP